MSISIRIFLVNDDDSIQRLPLARFERLHRCDPKESLPQYAGKRVRYASVALEMENRRPVDIIMIQHSYLNFDSEGRIDAAELEKAASLAVNMVPPLTNGRQTGHVVDASHKFYKKRYEDQYKWSPTPEIIESIVTAIFGKNR